MLLVKYLGGRGKDGTKYPDIMQFSDSKGDEKWIRAGDMYRSRYVHAVSVVDFTNFEKYCGLKASTMVISIKNV